jgi:hypothetical protein
LCFVCVAVVATSARAQFEEPDTIPRFSIGPTVEVVFRGVRGELRGGAGDVSFGGGPPVGARVDYRLTRTLAIGAAGSWSRINEKLETSTSISTGSGRFTQWQVSGELMLKVKPNIPGYFILGGGARRIIPDGDDPNEYWHDAEPFTDGLGILGAGVELGSRRSRVFKFDLRVYLVAPADQLEIETKSVSLDFALGLSLMLRL